MIYRTQIHRGERKGLASTEKGATKLKWHLLEIYSGIRVNLYLMKLNGILGTQVYHIVSTRSCSSVKREWGSVKNSPAISNRS
jgi:hypothetical protein